MTQTATVEKILERGQVLLSVVRQTACGHNCENCAGCGVQASAVRVVAKDLIGVHPGEKVVVSSQNKQVIGVAALVYLCPAAAFLAGYGLGDALARAWGGYAAALHVLVTAGITLLGCLPAWRYDRTVRRERRISYEIVGRL